MQLKQSYVTVLSHGLFVNGLFSLNRGISTDSGRTSFDLDRLENGKCLPMN